MLTIFPFGLEGSPVYRSLFSSILSLPAASTTVETVLTTGASPLFPSSSSSTIIFITIPIVYE